MNEQPSNNRRGAVRARTFAAVAFGTVGGVLVVIGTVLILVAFTVLQWFRGGAGGPFEGAGSHSTFQDVHDLIDTTKRQFAAAGISKFVSFGASDAYFSWLGWVLLLASVVLGALAVSSVGGSVWGVRWLGAVVAATGLAVTFVALNLITLNGSPPSDADVPSFSGYLTHSGVGAWSAIVGFLLILIGCLVPHQDR